MAGLCALSGCQSNGGKLNEPATLHTGEVVGVLPRSDILASREIHESLTHSGIVDSEIKDGSVVIVRTLCCGPPSTSNLHGALNSQGLSIQIGDVVEFLWPGDSVNSVTRVVQPAGTTNGACWWDPKDDKLWRRVMFCSWMPEQGWVKQEWQLTIGWYKPAVHP